MLLSDANPAAVNLLGKDCKGRKLREVLPGLEQRWWQVLAKVVSTGASERLELHAGSLDRWFELHLTAVPAGEDKTGVAILFQDITDRKSWELSQRRLVGELNHRVKNMLAVVRSIAQQTQSSTATPVDFNEAFQQRLAALAEAHDLLTQHNWTGAGLEQIARQSLATLTGATGRIALEGPPVQLEPNAVIVLAMVMNELGTNALKYGALSVPTGRVLLNWHLIEPGDGSNGRSVRLSWIERFGPAASPPDKTGFGLRMLKDALRLELDGGCDLEFKKTGLECRIEFPLDGEQLTEREQRN